MLQTKPNDIALALGVIGMMTATILTFVVSAQELTSLWFGWGGLIVLAGASAWLAGRLCAGLFGHAGVAGWFSAALGAFLSTTCGAMIAGTFVFPFYGTLIAPLVVFVEGASNPLLGGTWALTMAGLHLFVVKTKDYRAMSSEL